MTNPDLAALSEAATCTLDDCPPGLFWFGDTLGFKSEYTTTLENPRRYQCDAYVVASGEYFHGGARDTAERATLIVQPVSAGNLVHIDEGMREAIARAEAAEAEVKRLTYDGIHTCHDQCPRLPCVQRREIAALTAQLAEARESERAAMTEVNGLKDALAQVGGTFDPDEDAWP